MDTAQELSNRFSGELSAAITIGIIVMDENVGGTMREFRQANRIKQSAVSRELDISPSVLSDYEHGRRQSPGVKFLKRYVLAIYKLAGIKV